MASQKVNEGWAPLGSQVVILVHTDSKPKWCRGVVVEISPFVVEIPISNLNVSEGERVVVVHDHGQGHVTACPRVLEVANRSEVQRIKFACDSWTSIENRSDNRYRIDSRAILRLVAEENVECSFTDQIVVVANMSRQGALVEHHGILADGQLVDFRIQLEPARPIRAIGIVVHSSEETGMAGIKFLEFVGASGQWLFDYIERLAA